MRQLGLLVAGLSIALSALTIATAAAEPIQPSTAPGSSSDDLADMVMDAIDHRGPATPSTTVAPAPGH